MINHSEAVYVIRRRRNVIATQVAYVINTKDYIYTFGDAIRLRRLHTRDRVITYQSFGLDKKELSKSLVLFLVEMMGTDGLPPIIRYANTRLCSASPRGFDSHVTFLYKKYSPAINGKTIIFGGDDGSRTHVRKSIPETFYERSLSFKIPLEKRR